MNFLAQRAQARERFVREEREFKPALMRLCKAFGGGDTLSEFLYGNLIEPSFGRGVTLANRWKSDTEAVCAECSRVFASYVAVCPGCGEARRLLYRKVAR